MERRWDIKKSKILFSFCVLSPIALMTTISCSETTQKAVYQQKKKSIPEKIEEYKDLAKRFHEELLKQKIETIELFSKNFTPTFGSEELEKSRIKNLTKDIEKAKKENAEELQKSLDRVKDFPNNEIPNEESLDRQINLLKTLIFGPSS
ncbi:hypothetical protein [Mycoplasma sp. Z386]